MVKLTVLLTIMLFVTGIQAYSQTRADSVRLIKDSATMAKKQKAMQELSQKISEQKASLAILESKVEELKENARKKADAAKASAVENEKAAAALSNDAHDRKKAKQIRKAADQAADDAKASRQAAEELKDHQDEIESLKSKITSNEKKLSKLQPKP